MTGKSSSVRGVLFDKDGTLFDFRATWDVWAANVIETLSGGDAKLRSALGLAARYDLEAKAFLPDSPVIAGTNREAAECFASALPHRELAEIEAFLVKEAAKAPLAAAVPLEPLLSSMRQGGLALGVMTNDSEVAAHAQLANAGVAQLFDFIAGFDSGFGAKPAPEPLLAFADACGLTADEILMVGDSSHDLIAGRSAGMRCVGVLTGVAQERDLAPFADVVLPDIGHLPHWIAAHA